VSNRASGNDTYALPGPRTREFHPHSVGISPWPRRLWLCNLEFRCRGGLLSALCDLRRLAELARWEGSPVLELDLIVATGPDPHTPCLCFANAFANFGSEGVPE